jgi:uncharacterized protein YdeI (YjbR/CyaY-like superfamily)
MKPEKTAPAELPIMPFKHQKAWSAWLDKNHAKSPGVWLQIAKKDSGVDSVTYDEAVESALCYGWIDGQKKSHDAASWLQKFTPRGAKSIWSKINREKAERLIREGDMKPAGLAAVDSAKRDGRWEAAYDSHTTATVSEDFQTELDRSPQAKAFFATLNSANRYAILWRIQTAKKAETRAKRIQQYIAMLERGEKIHP